MKTLDLSAVTPSVGIIPQKDTVEHITSSYLEGVASLAKSIIPVSWQTGHLVILHGCVDTGVHPTRTLSAGAVFYNGEVYQVPAASFTTSGAQIGIWTLQDVNTGTESKLTDGSDVHILVNNKFVFAAGLAGSGDFDEGDELTLYKWDDDYNSLLDTSPTFSGATVDSILMYHRIIDKTVEVKTIITATITNDTIWNVGSVSGNVSSFCNINTNYLAINQGVSGFAYAGNGMAIKGTAATARGVSSTLIDTTTSPTKIRFDVFFPFNLSNSDIIRFEVLTTYLV